MLSSAVSPKFKNPAPLVVDEMPPKKAKKQAVAEPVRVAETVKERLFRLNALILSSQTAAVTESHEKTVDVRQRFPEFHEPAAEFFEIHHEHQKGPKGAKKEKRTKHVEEVGVEHEKWLDPELETGCPVPFSVSRLAESITWDYLASPTFLSLPSDPHHPLDPTIDSWHPSEDVPAPMSIPQLLSKYDFSEISFLSPEVGVALLGAPLVSNVSALSALYPQSPEGLPVPSETDKYAVKLFVDGRWRLVCVDSRMPCDQEGKSLIVSGAVDQAVSLVAKALYKVSNGFLSIPGLVHFLTGHVPQTVSVGGMIGVGTVVVGRAAGGPSRTFQPTLVVSKVCPDDVLRCECISSDVKCFSGGSYSWERKDVWTPELEERLGVCRYAETRNGTCRCFYFSRNELLFKFADRIYSFFAPPMPRAEVAGADVTQQEDATPQETDSPALDLVEIPPEEKSVLFLTQDQSTIVKLYVYPSLPRQPKSPLSKTVVTIEAIALDPDTPEIVTSEIREISTSQPQCFELQLRGIARVGVDAPYGCYLLSGGSQGVQLRRDLEHSFTLECHPAVQTAPVEVLGKALVEFSNSIPFWNCRSFDKTCVGDEISVYIRSEGDDGEIVPLAAPLTAKGLLVVTRTGAAASSSSPQQQDEIDDAVVSSTSLSLWASGMATFKPLIPISFVGQNLGDASNRVAVRPCNPDFLPDRDGLWSTVVVSCQTLSEEDFVSIDVSFMSNANLVSILTPDEMSEPDSQDVTYMPQPPAREAFVPRCCTRTIELTKTADTVTGQPRPPLVPLLCTSF